MRETFSAAPKDNVEVRKMGIDNDMYIINNRACGAY